MTNKQVIEQKLSSLNYELGCYDSKLEGLTKTELKKVLSRLEEEATDIEISIKRKKYVLEINTIDNEKDFDVIVKEEYINRYGSL